MIKFDKTRKIFYSTKINDENYFSGFGTKLLADGGQIDEIKSFFNQEVADYRKIIVPKQIHGTNIIEVKDLKNKKISQADKTDGLITNLKNIILTVRTADCVPIIFADKKNGLIGISHQGWKGSLMRMAQKMVEKMIKRGGEKQFFKIAIGPSIGDCCYFIDKYRSQKFKKEFNHYFDKVLRLKKEKKYLNLGLLNFLQLQEIGIRKNQIEFFPFCTQCDDTRFFSYRREKDNLSGQMISFVVKL